MIGALVFAALLPAGDGELMVLKGRAASYAECIAALGTTGRRVP